MLLSKAAYYNTPAIIRQPPEVPQKPSISNSEVIAVIYKLSP
jgi:hypothetical protein